MSKRNRGRRGTNLSNLQPDRLVSEYQNSVQKNPMLHNPAILHGTASPDHIRRDFLTWLSGYTACYGQQVGQSQNFGQYQSGQFGGQPQHFSQSPQSGFFSQGQQGRRGPTLFQQMPGNISEALHRVISNYSGSGYLSHIA